MTEATNYFLLYGISCFRCRVQLVCFKPLSKYTYTYLACINTSTKT